MTTRVVLNKQGFIDVLNSAGVVTLIAGKAELIANQARNDNHDDTFEYEDSIDVVIDQADGSRGALPRARARVVAFDRKAHILEAKYGILARALDAAGGS